MKKLFIIIALTGICIACKKQTEPTRQISYVVSITDTSINEGNSGTSFLNFVVSLDKEVFSNDKIDIRYNTVEGTAMKGEDFIEQNNRLLTFITGEKSKTIRIGILGDEIKEEDETFSLNIRFDSSRSNIKFDKEVATGKIKNDDK